MRKDIYFYDTWQSDLSSKELTTEQKLDMYKMKYSYVYKKHDGINKYVKPHNLIVNFNEDGA